MGATAHQWQWRQWGRPLLPCQSVVKVLSWQGGVCGHYAGGGATVIDVGSDQRAVVVPGAGCFHHVGSVVADVVNSGSGGVAVDICEVLGTAACQDLAKISGGL